MFSIKMSLFRKRNNKNNLHTHLRDSQMRDTFVFCLEISDISLFSLSTPLFNKKMNVSLLFCVKFIKVLYLSS